MKKKIILNEDREVVSEELIEKKDQPRQEEDVALAEAASTGATADETMENNLDIPGSANHPVDSTESCTGGKIENRMEPGDEHKNERLKKDVGSDREEGGATGEPQ
mmetsp:Transcript_19331/g.21336  ORF Transcript_19331/g.21336 Transcript_19331/m.21336 type:complete len:106 (+) Transcript_19331:268-585(+)